MQLGTDKATLLRKAIEQLNDANVSMQTALGDTEECFDLHCGIENMIDELQEVLDRVTANA